MMSITRMSFVVSLGLCVSSLVLAMYELSALTLTLALVCVFVLALQTNVVTVGRRNQPRKLPSPGVYSEEANAEKHY